MGHSITAIILKGEYELTKSREYDLIEVDLGFNLSMFFIDGFYSAFWQEKLQTIGCLETNCQKITWFPRENSLYQLMKNISKENPVEFMIIQTDYHGGVGNQNANLYKEDKNVDLNINTISKGLQYLRVNKGSFYDEFEAVGLNNHRTNPEFLDKYRDLADELGV